MSMFTRVGDFAHDKLLHGSTQSALSHISSGIGGGAIYGVGSSLYTGNDTLLGGAISGGIQGGLLGAGTRYGSMMYAKGVANHIMNTTDSSGKVFAGVKESLVRDVSNFKFGHFVNANNNNVHANYWHPDASTFKQVPFQNYNPRFSQPDDLTNKVRATKFETNEEQGFKSYF